VYVNDIWRNIDSSIRLFADDCIIYRKITNKNDTENLHKHLDTLGEWEAENGIKINPSKSKGIRFTRAWVKNPLGYSLGDQKIPEASSCKYLGIILRSDLNWVGQANYTVRKALKALHFVMHVLKKETNTRLAYTSLVCPIREYGSACWDICTERQINALDQVQKKAAQFTNHTEDSDWKTFAYHRMIAHLYALFKAYSGERAWKAIRDMLRRPKYLSRADHVWKIRGRKQRTDIRKYSFVNRTIKNCNQLPAEVLGTFPCKPKIFRNRVRKAIINEVK
jgi:hypothetical protein